MLRDWWLTEINQKLCVCRLSVIIYSIKLMHHQYNVKNSRIKRSNLCGMKRGDKAKEGTWANSYIMVPWILTMAWSLHCNNAGKLFLFPPPSQKVRLPNPQIKDTFPCGAGFYQFWSLNTSRVHIHVDQMQSKFLKYLDIRIDDGCRKWNNVGQRSVMERCVTYTATIERLKDRLQGPGTLYDVDVCFGVRRLFSGAL